MMLPDILEFEFTIDGDTEMRLVAMDGDRSFIVGMVCLKNLGQKAATAYQLSVEHDFQSRGIGAALMHAAEQVAATKGSTALSLLVKKTNQEAMNFYQHIGYSPAWVENGHILMTKKLE